MADSLKVELIARDFNRMLEEFADIDGRIEFKDVVLGVAERVMRGASNYTKSADPAKIRTAYGKKQYTSFNGKVYRISNRFPDAIWNEIQRIRAEGLDVKLNARGLSRQSWNHVGASFGSSLAGDSPAYVTAANYKGRQYPEDGSSSESGTGGEYALTIKNDSPIVQAAGGKNALARAMNGETRYFEKNMEHRAFSTLASRVAKYPGVFARNSAV
jgi:hypothetical protein